jgi:hypothetical protein
VLGALGLGMLLGGVGLLCRWGGDDSSLLCTALQAALSTTVLATLVPARPQDLLLETEPAGVPGSSAQQCERDEGHLWATDRRPTGIRGLVNGRREKRRIGFCQLLAVQQGGP